MAEGYNSATGRNSSGIGGGGFNRLAAGAKRYGAGRRAPNVGKTTDIAGYNQRDMRNKARKEALLRYGGRN